MYAKGIDILITPTADDRDTWQATLQHIACEGRCFVVSCNQFVTKDTYPEDIAFYTDIADDPDIMCRGGSAVVGPLGQYITQPYYGKEGVLVADLDLSLIAQSRYDFDVVGHYSRPDVFQLSVQEAKQQGVLFAK
jgi:nitrilase